MLDETIQSCIDGKNHIASTWIKHKSSKLLLPKTKSPTNISVKKKLNFWIQPFIQIKVDKQV